ncbi:MAG: HPr family phosphocarrier protein [Alphaproteobacteria bacterium]|jgi:phosphocarrier protein|nr:HPr family phosphocarrier protein [Alphaproteobacteria bacterium]
MSENKNAGRGKDGVTDGRTDGATEVRRTVTIVNRRGLHARASARFVGAVSELPDGIAVEVAKDGNSASGGSILGLMMLGAAKGDTVELIIAGANAESVADGLAALVESGFGEE